MLVHEMLLTIRIVGMDKLKKKQKEKRNIIFLKVIQKVLIFPLN